MSKASSHSVKDEFQRSRIYAQGWNAAGRLTAEERDDIDPAQIAELNPYKIEAERSRWREGFLEALGK